MKVSHVIVHLRVLALAFALSIILTACGGGGGGTGGGGATGGSSGGTVATGSGGGGGGGSTGNPFNNPLVPNQLIFNGGLVRGAKDARAPGDPASQANPAVASNGTSGIMYTVVDDDRDVTTNGRDIYAQKQNQAADLLWGAGGVPVCTATGNQVGPAAAVDSSGFLVAAWQDSRLGNRAHVFLNRQNAAGTRLLGDTGLLVSGDLIAGDVAGEQTNPGVVTTSNGLAYVWWFETGSTPGIGLAYVDLVAGTVSWRITIASNAAFQGAPVGMADGANGCILGWVMDPAGGDNLGVYGQRITSAGTQLWNGGVPLPVLQTANRQYQVALCTNGAQGAYYTGRDDRTPADPIADPTGQQSSEVYLQGVSATGTPEFIANGVLAGTPAAGHKLQVPDVAFANGKVQILWDRQQGNTANHAVFATQITPATVRSGARAPVGDNGTLVASAGEFTFPKVESDSTQGFHYLWSDQDGGGQTVNYNYQRASGALANAQNLRFSISAANRRNPQGVPVAQGYLGTAWEQFGSGPHQVFGRPLSDP